MIHNVDPQLSQWDVGRSVSVSGSNATHVHFANQGESKAVIIEITGGSAKIPDFLLQSGKTLLAYAVLDGVTIESKSFAVRKRERPENYVYEDDQRNYIYELISNTEKAAEEAILATQSANEAADKANQAAKSWVIMGEVKGESVVIDDAIDQTFAGFRIFGKTTQDGTPTPETPVELVSVGDGGSITVNVTGANEAQSMTISTPNGLPGIPVTSGGNYTDGSGQMWYADEKDFERGVYIQRCYAETITMVYEETNNRYIGETTKNANQKVSEGIGIFVLTDKLSYNENAGTIGTQTNGVRISYGNKKAVIAYYNGEVISSLDVLYPLETPIEKPLPKEELAAYASLQTSRGITTVSNDKDAYMDVQYQMDAKKYIDRKVASSFIYPATIG